MMHTNMTKNRIVYTLRTAYEKQVNDFLPGKFGLELIEVFVYHVVVGCEGIFTGL